MQPARRRFVLFGHGRRLEVVGPLRPLGRQVAVLGALQLASLLLDLAEAVLRFLRVILPLGRRVPASSAKGSILWLIGGSERVAALQASAQRGA